MQELATKLEAERARRSLRIQAVAALGPLTMLAGLVWALLQPYRITLLDPDGTSAWRLVVQAPLLVIAVGLLFALVVAPGLVDDLAAEEEAER